MQKFLQSAKTCVNRIQRHTAAILPTFDSIANNTSAVHRIMATLAQSSAKTSALTSYTRSAKPSRRNAVVCTAMAPVSTAASQRVKLGSSDLMVSCCCLGTMTWGVQNTEDEAHSQLSYAFDCGINFLDTAELYPVPPAAEWQGRTDQYIGTWLKNRRRPDVILASKVVGYCSGNQTYLRKDKSLPRVNAKNIIESVDSSLQRLQTDYIDLLQVHWPDRYVSLFGAGPYDISQERPDDVPFEEQLEALQKVVEAGKVRYIGVSNETSYGVMKFVQAAEAAGLPRIVSIQNSYSLLVRTAFETDLAEVCAPRQCNVGLLAYSPLAGGALSGKYITGKPEDMQNSRFNRFPGYMARYNKSLAQEAVAHYVEIARRHNLTAAQLAVAFCRSRWFVTSTIIGATSMEQLKENIEAFDVELSEECLADIDSVFRRFRDPAFN